MPVLNVVSVLLTDQLWLPEGATFLGITMRNNRPYIAAVVNYQRSMRTYDITFLLDGVNIDQDQYENLIPLGSYAHPQANYSVHAFLRRV